VQILRREGEDPDSDMMMAARWLLNITAMTIGRYPQDVPPEFLIDRSVFESEIDFPRFENVAPKLGLETFNLSGGAIVDDFDGDDYLDIVTSTCDPAGQMRYFRSHRDGTFSDETSFVMNPKWARSRSFSWGCTRMPSVPTTTASPRFTSRIFVQTASSSLRTTTESMRCL